MAIKKPVNARPARSTILPKCLTLIAGAAGCGKTLSSMEFLVSDTVRVLLGLDIRPSR
jgi:hypothetical protein